MVTRNDEKPRIAFFGTPDFAATILHRILNEGMVDIVAVVTNPDRPAGRSSSLQASPVKRIALKHNLDCYQPEHPGNINLRETLGYLAPDLCVVAAYGHIIPQALLAIPQHGFINVHPSLLPRHRGPAPVTASIDAGDKETGVTIMLMDEEMDHGPVLAQQRIAIEDNETRSTLTDRLADHGARLLAETIPQWINGVIEPEEQNHDAATYTTLLTKDDGRIDWSQPADVIERHVRAHHAWPGAWTQLPDGTRLKILAVNDHPDMDAESSDDTQHKHTVGTVISHNNKPAVVAGMGIVVLNTVQPAGKQVMNGKDFLNGYHDLLGAALI